MSDPGPITDAPIPSDEQTAPSPERLPDAGTQAPGADDEAARDAFSGEQLEPGGRGEALGRTPPPPD